MGSRYVSILFKPLQAVFFDKKDWTLILVKKIRGGRHVRHQSTGLNRRRQVNRVRLGKVLRAPIGDGWVDGWMDGWEYVQLCSASSHRRQWVGDKTSPDRSLVEVCELIDHEHLNSMGNGVRGAQAKVKE